MFEEVFKSYDEAEKGTVSIDAEYYVADGYFPNGDPRPFKRIRVIDTFEGSVMVVIEESATGERHVCTKSALKRKV